MASIAHRLASSIIMHGAWTENSRKEIGPGGNLVLVLVPVLWITSLLYSRKEESRARWDDDISFEVGLNDIHIRPTMCQLPRAVLCFLIFGLSRAEGASLVIGEYVEGSGWNKAVAVRNAGADEAVDLSAYALWKASNGADWRPIMEVSSIRLPRPFAIHAA